MFSDLKYWKQNLHSYKIKTPLEKMGISLDLLQFLDIGQTEIFIFDLLYKVLITFFEMANKNIVISFQNGTWSK